MKITKVEYSKTFNLGNYQSAKIGFEAEVEDTKEEDVLEYLKHRVEVEGAKLKR